MRIVSIMATGLRDRPGLGIIRLDPGPNAIYGPNCSGKSRLFLAMRSLCRQVADVTALPGWTVDRTDPSDIWSDVPRVFVEVDVDERDCVFLDDGLLLRLQDEGAGPWQGNEDDLRALHARFARRLERMAGHDIDRRGVPPALQSRNGTVFPVLLDDAPTGLWTLAILALTLALGDDRSPRAPLVIDDGVLGTLDHEHRDRVIHELTDLDGQVVLFTGDWDVAQQLGVRYALGPVARERGDGRVS